MNIEPGQRWRMPSGSCWQVVRFSEDDARNVVVAPVIDGVLSSMAHEISEFTCDYLTLHGVPAR
jgi:cell wall assembly regulator SMI1